MQYIYLTGRKTDQKAAGYKKKSSELVKVAVEDKLFLPAPSIHPYLAQRHGSSKNIFIQLLKNKQILHECLWK